MSTLIALFRLWQLETKTNNQKKGRTMNPLPQFKKIQMLPLLIPATLAVLATLSAPPAGAEPPVMCGVTVTSLIGSDPPQPAHFDEINTFARLADYDWTAKLKIDQFDFYVVEVMILPGGWLGWHSHPGLSFGVGKSGTATFYEADDCAPQVIPTGGSFFEPANEVHLVRNESMTEPLVNVVIQLVPPGAPS